MLCVVTIARLVEKTVKENPSLEIMLSKDLVSFSKLARYLKTEVEKELGKPVKESAIIVAIKRLQNKAAKSYEKPTEFSARSITTYSNLVEIGVITSSQLREKVQEMYAFSELSEGAMLHISEGVNQTAFVFSGNLEPKMRKVLEGEKILIEVDGVAQLSVSFEKDMFETPGFLVYVLKELAWNGINVIEIISTYTELNIMIKGKDLTKAYKILEDMLFA